VPLQGMVLPLAARVTGGTQARFSSLALVFGALRAVPFGSQAINGAVRVRE